MIYHQLHSQKIRLLSGILPEEDELLDAAKYVSKVEQSIKYTFKNKVLCMEALNNRNTASSVPVYFNDTVITVDSNIRLALVGDAFLRMALVGKWYRKYPPETSCSVSG